MEGDALENMLFGLFEKQTTWSFVQLQRETDQPAPWLKVRQIFARGVQVCNGVCWSLACVCNHQTSRRPG